MLSTMQIHMPARYRTCYSVLEEGRCHETLSLTDAMKLVTKPFIIDSSGSFQDGSDLVKRFFMICSLKLLLLTIIDVIRISLRMQSSPILKVGQVVPVSWYRIDSVPKF